MTRGGVPFFSPLVAAWFTERFATPTEAQEAGWPAIASGRDVLIAAPTGSGKTLAAFLWSLDRLIGLAAAGALEDRTYVVYVSPLKALGNDVQKNLATPLAELRARAEAAGTPLPDLRVMVRTGDTPAAERQAMTRRPPHVLITTPESLYILLTAEKSRRFLAGAETIIVDEIHAVAPDKRGAHLALTLERLDALAARPLQRIGLSATQRPIDLVGRLLVGSARPDPVLVDVGHRRPLDLGIWLPDQPVGPIATHEYWGAVLDRVAAFSAEHRTTICFVHTRRLVERCAHLLAERVGEGRVAAHHGSMARRIRLEAEEKLKSGRVPLVVATASLELGIDVGAVDLVCHVGAPRTLATLIQRVGRSGHARGATPKGVLFPLTRDDLVQAAASVRAVRTGLLDALVVPPGPRDILAQQCVAAVASGELGVDELLALVRRAWPWRDLERAQLEELLLLLAEGVSTRRGRRSAHLHWDRVNDRLRARRGARLAAITGGGAIPDTADYDVIEEPAGLLVGKVNEDFAVESMRGDIFLLGNRSWRIRRVEATSVRVEDAAGAPPTVPFWFGEAPSRTRELSDEVSALRSEIVARAGEPRGWLMAACGLDDAGAHQLQAYVLEAAAALGGVVPSVETIVTERFFDEAGGMQLVVHAPFGGRINRAFGLVLRKRFCRTFNFELQAAASDDGIVLSLGAQHSFPLDGVLGMISRQSLADDLAQAALASPMFTNRWRWNATRSLALLRHESGRKVPMPLQRMRAEDLLAAVFPEQLGCQENMGGGPIPIPDHPLVTETVENCLHEAMDLRGLAAVLDDVAAGHIRAVGIDTIAPSPFSHEILSSNPYTYLDDAPLEERRARAVSLRQAVPQLAGGLGALDAAAVAEVAAQAWPVVRDADELHDALLSLGILPVSALARHGWEALAASLVAAGRATRAGDLLVAAERTALLRLVLPGVAFQPPVQDALFGGLAGRRGVETEEDALRAIVGGWLEAVGVVTVDELAARCGLPPGRVAVGLARLELAGAALRGRYRPGAAGEEWCDRTLLARIHRLTLGRLRREIEPVSAADLMRFWFRWQHVQPGTRLHGRRGLLEILGQLEGLELPARAWEEQVLPARMSRWDPDDLEHLCLAGEVAWGRLRVAVPDDADDEPRRLRAPGRAAPLALLRRESLPWLLAPAGDPGPLPPAAAAVHATLVRRGASFTADLARTAGLGVPVVEEALWTLVSHGLVTGDGIAGLRALIARPEDGRPTPARRRALPAGRWALLRDGDAASVDAAPADDDPERFALLLLRRWGVVVREVLARESRMPPWRVLLPALRALEARGTVRGGRFVQGMVGEQFALPEAVEALRAVRRREGSSETVTIAAADPLNLVGIVVPGARLAPALHETIVFRDGVPVEVAPDRAAAGA
ncbi:MAG: DEAD/DEAH box helicase [bacterium]|nr:DEAD/DEAH box helicase [bacterium]